MSETIQAPQEQPQVAKLSSFDRLSQDPQFFWGDNQPEKSTTTAPAPSVTEETNKLENTQTNLTIEPNKAEASPAQTKPGEVKTSETKPPGIEQPPTEVKPEEVGFTDTASQSNEDGSWKSLIENLGYSIPEDFTEEKGQEIFVQLKEDEIAQRLEEVKNFKELEVFSALPEKTQGEGKLIYELLKTGQSLNDIMAPYDQVKTWKGMTKEQLIRHSLEGTPGYTEEMINHKMEQIVANSHVDVEYNILMNEVNLFESKINQQRQEQILSWQAQQNQVKEQKRQNEYGAFKAALDKVPMFMDKKLSDENKATILTEYNNGYAQNIFKPEKLVKFMLFDKYGEQGLKYLQDRATESATVEKAKSQHNIPPVTTGGANRVEQTTTYKSGIERLANDPRFA